MLRPGGASMRYRYLGTIDRSSAVPVAVGIPSASIPGISAPRLPRAYSSSAGATRAATAAAGAALRAAVSAGCSARWLSCGLCWFRVFAELGPQRTSAGSMGLVSTGRSSRCLSRARPAQRRSQPSHGSVGPFPTQPQRRLCLLWLPQGPWWTTSFERQLVQV